jgi:hypothetical protein
MLTKLKSEKPEEPISYSEIDIQKIGGIMHLISKISNGVSRTRLLKLMYLIDEASVIELGVPVSPIEYKVAKLGPLAQKVWSELQPDNTTFGDLVNVDLKITGDSECFLITPIGNPNLELFSEYETELIETIVKKYKETETDVLINDILHHEDTLWGKMVKEHNIDFDKLPTRISNYTIDFSSLIKDSEEKLHYYNSYHNTR